MGLPNPTLTILLDGKKNVVGAVMCPESQSGHVFNHELAAPSECAMKLMEAESRIAGLTSLIECFAQIFYIRVYADGSVWAVAAIDGRIGTTQHLRGIETVLPTLPIGETNEAKTP